MNKLKLSKEAAEVVRILDMTLPVTENVSRLEREIFDAAVSAFDRGDHAIATEYFMKLVLHRNDCGIYQINKLVSAFLEQRQLFPRLFISQFSQLGKRENINTYRFDPLDKILPYPAMVYNLCLVMRMISRETDAILFVLERLQKATMPKEIPDKLLVKTDLVAIDVLMEDSEFKIAYEEIGRVESEYENLEPHIIIKLQQFKVRCLVALKNLKNIKKEYKTLFALTKSDHPSYHVGSFIKAEHEYLVGNFTKAYKTMDSFLKKYCDAELKEEFLKNTGDNIGMLIKSNQACCEFNIYKPATALWRLREAFAEYSLHRNMLTYPAYCMYQFKQIDVLNYNQAIALMYSQNYKEAIPLLCKSVRAFPFNPRLWLRLGQACLAVVSPRYENLHITPKKMIQGMSQDIAAGTLEQDVYVDTVNDCIYELPRVQHRTVLAPRLVFPSSKYSEICVRKALQLYRGHVEDGDGIRVCPCTPMYDRKAKSTLRAEILSFMTHTCLRTEAYTEAFTYAMELLAIENAPGQLRYMAKVDIGEAATKLKDARKAEPFIEEDDDIAEMLSRPSSRTESSNEPSHYVLKPIEDRWCRSAYWLEAHRAICQILYKTKTLYFYEALEQTREWLKKLGDEVPFPLFTLALFLFKFTGCVDEAEELWHKNIGQFYPMSRKLRITRNFSRISRRPKLPPKPKIHTTPRKRKLEFKTK